MAKKKFPLLDLRKYLQNKGQLALLKEITEKRFNMSTSRRGFAITRLKEENIFDDFMVYAKKIYPGKEFLIQDALNQYHRFETVPETEYLQLEYREKRRFSAGEIKKLKFYVYQIIDPGMNEVFYVGKGRRNRMFEHLKKALNGDPSEKAYKIRKILSMNEKPIYKIVKYGMSEAEAFRLEGELIDHYGLENLTNIQSGVQK